MIGQFLFLLFLAAAATGIVIHNRRAFSCSLATVVTTTPTLAFGTGNFFNSAAATHSAIFAPVIHPVRLPVKVQQEKRKSVCRKKRLFINRTRVSRKELHRHSQQNVPRAPTTGERGERREGDG